LQYAASNGKRLGDTQLSTVPLNDFEADIFDVLSGQGLKLVPQVGASHYRIDMVAEHPKRPGRFVLAIECDGASYHSSYTARDRDRLRQQQLESLGWRFHRIWSTDWFLRKEDEVQRTIAAFQEAVKFADRIDADPSVAIGVSNDHSKSCEWCRGSERRCSGPKTQTRDPLKAFHSSVQPARTGRVDSLDWFRRKTAN